jgi:hypothetical protein
MKDEQLFEAFSDIDQYYLNENIPHERNRRRFSKFGTIFAVIVVLVLTCCSYGFLKFSYCGFYLVHEKDGYYLESYKNGAYESDSDIMGGALIEARLLTFHSVKEMREDFLTYNFTEDEISNIRALIVENNGRIDVPDLNNLCEPICPGGYIFTGKVDWAGSDYYSFEIQNNGSPHIAIGGFSRKSHAKGVDRLLNYSGDEIVEVIEKRQIEDRNATLYVRQSRRNGNTSCMVVYMLVKDDKTIYVEERYKVSNPDELTPDTIPSYINLYIQDGEVFASAYLQDFDYRPSAEWLLRFGLKKVQ